MAITQKKIRLGSVWLGVPLFLLLARPTPNLMLIGAAIALLGLALRAWAAGTIQKNVVLTVSGPYAFTRNPLYLGSFLIGAGLATASGSLIIAAAVLVFFAAMYSWTIRREQRWLEDAFGEEYRAYAAAVPVFLPRLRPASLANRDKLSFSVGQYLDRREWQAGLGAAFGFLALLAKRIWLG